VPSKVLLVSRNFRIPGNEMAKKRRVRRTPEEPRIESPSEYERAHRDDSSSELTIDELSDARLAQAFRDRVNADLVLAPNHPFFAARIEEIVREGTMNKEQATRKLRKELLTLYTKPVKTDGQPPDRLFKQIRSVCENQLHSDRDRISFLERMISKTFYRSVTAFLEEYLREKKMGALFDFNILEVIANGHTMAREDRIQYYGYVSREAKLKGRFDVPEKIEADLLQGINVGSDRQRDSPMSETERVQGKRNQNSIMILSEMIRHGRRQHAQGDSVDMYTVARAMNGRFGLSYRDDYQKDAIRQRITRLIKDYDHTWTWRANLLPLIRSDKPFSL